MKPKPTRKQKKIGGKVIGHGGFGCIFHPNLECRLAKSGKIIKPSTKRITKLMKNKFYFDEESEDVGRVYKILPKIRNYKKYFVYETVKCKPIKIRRSDLENFDSECKKLNNLTPKQLLQLNALLYTYGGENLKDYVDKIGADNNKMANIHDCLIDSFVNAILPLNSLGVYHCDIKLDNMLFNNGFIRIIDWGFVSFFKDSDTAIPIKFTQFPIHFNMPITIILFSPYFQETIYRRYGDDLKAACRQAIIESIEGSGHFNDLESLYRKTKPYTLGLDFIDFMNECLFRVITLFTDRTGTFNAFEYFRQLYVRNVDLHGFVTAYYYFAKTFVPEENRAALNAYTFEVVFNSFTKRLEPIDIISNIQGMKYFAI